MLRRLIATFLALVPLAASADTPRCLLGLDRPFRPGAVVDRTPLADAPCGSEFMEGAAESYLIAYNAPTPDLSAGGIVHAGESRWHIMCQADTGSTDSRERSVACGIVYLTAPGFAVFVSPNLGVRLRVGPASGASGATVRFDGGPQIQCSLDGLLGEESAGGLSKRLATARELEASWADPSASGGTRRVTVDLRGVELSMEIARWVLARMP